MTGYTTDADGRIVAAPSHEGPLSGVTAADLDDALALDFSNDALSERVSMKPERGDAPGKQYRTVGGNLVTTAKTAEGEVAFWYCYGCGTRDEIGYGWDDVARERAQKHAADCRAV
ncbi:hypothetical protein LUX09_05255 [Streptomyces albogriseolus]|nr:hypothetical protein [Streptomyces albogriseolus]